MHSLANLVVWTKLYFLLPKDEEKNLKNFCLFSILNYFWTRNPRKLKTRETCQMVCRVENLARSCPLCMSFSKNWRNTAETKCEKPKKAQKTSNFPKPICARKLTSTFVYAPSSPQQLCILRRTAPGNPRWDIGRQIWKIWKKAIFGHKNGVFGQQNVFSGQNGSGHLFL